MTIRGIFYKYFVFMCIVYNYIYSAQVICINVNQFTVNTAAEDQSPSRKKEVNFQCVTVQTSVRALNVVAMQ